MKSTYLSLSMVLYSSMQVHFPIIFFISRATYGTGFASSGNNNMEPKIKDSSHRGDDIRGSSKRKKLNQRVTRSLTPVESTVPTKIRPMQMKDLSAVFQLGNSIFTASKYPNMYRLWDDFTVVENYHESDEFCFVVQTTAKEDLIGFVLGKTVTKEATGTRGYIQWIAVAPAYRRKGLATQLLNHFSAVASTKNVSVLLAELQPTTGPPLKCSQRPDCRFRSITCI